MKLTAAQAAAQVGMTKAGIIRSIHKGKLSATRNEAGRFEIDPAELFRAYSPVSTSVKSDGEIADNLTDDQSRSYQEKVYLLERIIDDKDDVIADLRSRLDAEADERRKLTLLLTTTQPQPRSWWAKLIGRE
jgi:hypothetical protein